ncbi:hypothetical protein Tco_1238015 [Tanacetum coccineum]
MLVAPSDRSILSLIFYMVIPKISWDRKGLTNPSDKSIPKKLHDPPSEDTPIKITTGYFKVRLASHNLVKYMQAFEDLVKAIKSIETCNIARNDLLIKFDFSKFFLKDLREIGSPKVNLNILDYIMGLAFDANASSDWKKFDNGLVRIYKLIVDQWKLNKTVADVVKEIKKPNLEDKVPEEGSKCVHYGNI